MGGEGWGGCGLIKCNIKFPKDSKKVNFKLRKNIYKGRNNTWQFNLMTIIKIFDKNRA